VGDPGGHPYRPRGLRVADPPPRRRARGVHVRRRPGRHPAGATAFDIPGAELSHHFGDCSFETILRRYDLTDPVLWQIAAIVHEADLDDQRYDAPEAPGLDMALRGLSMIRGDDDILRITGPVFDGIYEYCKRTILLGREPA
jgi:hypothetical protein